MSGYGNRDISGLRWALGKSDLYVFSNDLMNTTVISGRNGVVIIHEGSQIAPLVNVDRYKIHKTQDLNNYVEFQARAVVFNSEQNFDQSAVTCLFLGGDLCFPGMDEDTNTIYSLYQIKGLKSKTGGIIYDATSDIHTVYKGNILNDFSSYISFCATRRHLLLVTQTNSELRKAHFYFYKISEMENTVLDISKSTEFDLDHGSHYDFVHCLRGFKETMSFAPRDVTTASEGHYQSIKIKEINQQITIQDDFRTTQPVFSSSTATNDECSYFIQIQDFAFGLDYIQYNKLHCFNNRTGTLLYSINVPYDADKIYYIYNSSGLTFYSTPTDFALRVVHHRYVAANQKFVCIFIVTNPRWVDKIYVYKRLPVYNSEGLLISETLELVQTYEVSDSLASSSAFPRGIAFSF